MVSPTVMEAKGADEGTPLDAAATRALVEPLYAGKSLRTMA